MSLEEALNRNSDLLEKHNELLERVLSAAPASGSKAGAASAETEEKPKTTRSTKAADKKAETKAVTLDDVKPLFSGWLTEFPKNGDDDHPETAARKEALKGFLKDVGAPNLKEVPADKLADAKTWIEGQIANGRLTTDDEGGSDDDMLG